MKETCPTCGGSGQIRFFQGVSRFFLSSEECPACAGLGFPTAGDGAKRSKNQKTKPTKKRISNKPTQERSKK